MHHDTYKEFGEDTEWLVWYLKHGGNLSMIELREFKNIFKDIWFIKECITSWMRAS